MQIKAAKELRVALISVWHTTRKRWPCYQFGVKGWGPEARLKKGPLMMSSYSANRDINFSIA